MDLPPAAGARWNSSLFTAANPSSHILEVGCGIGRLAMRCRFPRANGGYAGFHIVPQVIEWCKQHIVGPHDNIHFTLADVYNKEYNPKRSRQPADYQFPYEDETFTSPYLYRCSRTCCQLMLTDMSVRSHAY